MTNPNNIEITQRMMELAEAASNAYWDARSAAKRRLGIIDPTRVPVHAIHGTAEHGQYSELIAALEAEFIKAGAAKETAYLTTADFVDYTEWQHPAPQN